MILSEAWTEDAQDAYLRDAQDVANQEKCNKEQLANSLEALVSRPSLRALRTVVSTTCR
jgi:hypothetical protein